MHAATLTQSWMLELFAALPQYYGYHRRMNANHDEATFRLAQGQRLQDLGQRLLDGAETRAHLLSEEQHHVVELLTDDITTVLKLLNRSGAIALEGDPETVIPELQTVDAELMLMLEHLWANGDALFSHDGPVFDAACRTVAACLESFLRLAEERNRLLGLGWESEFGWKPSTRLGEGSEN